MRLDSIEPQVLEPNIKDCSTEEVRFHLTALLHHFLPVDDLTILLSKHQDVAYLSNAETAEKKMFEGMKNQEQKMFGRF